jgi:hypothetical protein
MRQHQLCVPARKAVWFHGMPVRHPYRTAGTRPAGRLRR